MLSGYTVLPPVYDRWQKSYGKDFSSLILPRLLMTIRKFRIPINSMVDLACGTGTLALLMARRGWKVVGVDGSEGMIQVATAKPVPKRGNARFVRQDMRRLRVPEPVGLVTSMFDSLNHLLTNRDLLTTFRGVYGALRPGGYFLFDTNNELCFTTIWTKSAVIHHRDFTLTLNTSYNPSTKRGVVRLFLDQPSSGSSSRQEERVRERCYSREEITVLLEKTGFDILHVEDFNFTPMREVGKIKTWWVAQRRLLEGRA